MEHLNVKLMDTVKLDKPHEFVLLMLEKVKNNQNDTDELKELIRCLDEAQLNQLWDSLSSHVITATINDAASATITEESKEDDDDTKISSQLLEIAVLLAKLAVVQDGCIIPQSLYQSVLLLHGYVLSAENSKLKEIVAELCELWWNNGVEGKDSLASAPLVYLLEKCATKKPVLKNIKRLWKMRDALQVIDGSSEMIWDLVLNLFTNNNFIRINQAQKLLSYVMITKVDLLKKMHSVIKFKLPKSSQAIVEIYASITISAWEKSEDEIVRSAIETDIIQDLMYTTIHLQRGGPKSLNSLLMNYLSKIHSRKSSPGVNLMLIRLYQPFLWRSLCAANGDVRANATQIFFSAFPLVDSSQGNQECETNLQKQFDLIFNLLEDEDHIVRQVSVTGVCKVLLTYWDQIPAEVSSDLLSMLFTKLAWDQASADVRIAVIQGIRLLLDNHLTHHSLSGVMPSLGDLFHDKVEKVRLEFVKLLLKIKHIRVFKVWKIVSKDHVFARLEVDNPSVCSKLVELTYKSFINDELDNHVQLERCIELVESGLEKARRFYRYIVEQINVQQAVKYMLLLRKCIMTCVSRHHQRGKENCKPSLCTTLANMTTGNNKRESIGSVSDNFTMIDNQLTQMTLKDGESSQDEGEEELSIDNTCVMRGLFDVICIIWAGFRKELSMSGNDELNKILCDKFSRALTDFFPIFEDEEIQQCLMYLASFLPVNQTSVLRKNALHRLRDLPSSSLTDAECGSLILCLCQWGLSNKVMEFCDKWASTLNKPTSARRKSRGDSDSDSQLLALVQVMNCLLTLPSCMEILRREQADEMETLSSKLNNSLVVAVRSLTTSTLPPYSVDLVSSLLIVDSKLRFVMYHTKGEKLSEYVTELCSLVRSQCVKHLEVLESVPEKTVLQNETKRPRRLLDLQSEELQGGNDSTLSLNTGGDASLADLSRKVIVTSLTVITNYLMLSSQPSEGVLYELNRIYKMSDSLASAGEDVMCCMTEMTIQLSRCSLIVGDKFPLPVKDCYLELIPSRLKCLNDAESMSGKNKTIWISLLRSFELLSDDEQISIASALTSSVLDLLGEEEMTPTLSGYITSTLKASTTLQSLIKEDLVEKLNHVHAGSNEKSTYGELRENIAKVLLRITERNGGSDAI